MLGLDTNVVVRYLVQDDPKQSAIANKIFEQQLTPGHKGFICSVVLCEIIWVLARAYKQPREKLREVINLLLLVDSLEVEHRDATWRALRNFTETSADFSDLLIAHINKEAGTTATVTFDRRAMAHPLFSDAGMAK